MDADTSNTRIRDICMDDADVDEYLEFCERALVGGDGEMFGWLVLVIQMIILSRVHFRNRRRASPVTERNGPCNPSSSQECSFACA